MAEAIPGGMGDLRKSRRIRWAVSQISSQRIWEKILRLSSRWIFSLSPDLSTKPRYASVGTHKVRGMRRRFSSRRPSAAPLPPIASLPLDFRVSSGVIHVMVYPIFGNILEALNQDVAFDPDRYQLAAG